MAFQQKTTVQLLFRQQCIKSNSKALRGEKRGSDFAERNTIKTGQFLWTQTGD